MGGYVALTQEQFEDRVKIKNPHIKIIGKYISSKKPIDCQCRECGNVWTVKQAGELNRTRWCPECSPRILKVGKNDLLTLYPDIQKYFCNPNDAINQFPKSNKRCMMKCPVCGRKKEMSIYQLTSHGFSCNYCSDGVSYPNKFGRELLRQLFGDDGYIPEWSPDWAKPFHYDNYFEYNNTKYILEMDGDLHYNKGFKKRKLSTIQNYDNQKDILAHNHNIIMIRIDCRKSDKNYIKNSIINSLLNDIVDLSIIDWDKCDIAGHKNILIEVCKYCFENKIYSTFDIGQYFGLHRHTIVKYLKVGAELGLCDYSEDKVKESKYRKIKEKLSIPIAVYNSIGVNIHNFLGIEDCCKEMKSLYGTYFSDQKVSKSIKQNIPYKGFIFKKRELEVIQ